MLVAHEHVGLGGEQQVEGEVRVGKGVPDDALVERGEVQHAQIAAEVAHVLDDLGGAGLAQAEVVTGALVFLGQFQERLHDERVVLGGDGELLRRLAAAAGVALLHEISLLHHLARVTQ